MTEYLIDRVRFARNSLSISLKEDLLRAGDKVVRPLIKILPSLNSYVVTADILEILGHIGGNDAYTALSTLLEDAPAGNLPKRLISQSCIKGLGYISDEASIASIIKCLSYYDTELRYTAVDVLSKIAHQKQDYKDKIINALQLAYQAETFESVGHHIEHSLEKLNVTLSKKDIWSNKQRTSTIITPPVSTPITASKSILEPVEHVKQQSNRAMEHPFGTIEPAQSTEQPFQEFQPDPNTLQTQNIQSIQSISSNKYAFLTDEQQKEILEQLLTCPDEGEKLAIIKDLGDSGNTQVIDELLTVVKSSNNRNIQLAAVDAILKIAPNDIKLRFLVLEYILDKRVIGQTEAKYALANSLRVAQIGLKRGGVSTKPIGSFLFVGPTGVGKTELAKALAESLYGSELQLIRIDMSEYTDMSDKNKLIGSPPGFAGCDEGGRLTQAVINKPQSVVLFDEIEKAHEEIFNLFLQLLDDGRLTDSKGTTVSFRDTVILMTSNVGSNHILEGIKANLDIEEIKEIIKDSLKTKFKPEFLNRLNEVVIFKPLTADDLLKVLDLKLKPTAKTLQEKYSITLEVSADAKNYIIEATQKQEFGFSPRELARIIDDEIVQPLSEKLLDLEISENYMGKIAIPRGGKAIIEIKDSKLFLDITNPINNQEA